ncbi:MAG: hypothetical protein MK364_12875, partial [Pirellulales bacterium]|nr:hypothetical protein [Pirellulales bacterium]
PAATAIQSKLQRAALFRRMFIVCCIVVSAKRLCQMQLADERAGHWFTTIRVPQKQKNVLFYPLYRLKRLGFRPTPAAGLCGGFEWRATPAQMSSPETPIEPASALGAAP